VAEKAANALVDIQGTQKTDMPERTPNSNDKANSRNNLLPQQQNPVIAVNNNTQHTDNKTLTPINAAVETVAGSNRTNIASLENIKKSGVTIKTPSPLDNTQAGPNKEVPSEDWAAAEPERKNKLRGFFRKTTRLFERTTNISATDGDDRLLIGGLAVRLK
jgi:hypothetical protein